MAVIESRRETTGMQESGVDRSHPQLRELVVEASQALARLDAARLEELALSCRALNREMAAAGDADRARLRSQALESASDMAVLGRVLEVTRSNLQVMCRLRELRRGRVEYSEAQARGWVRTESEHGDN